jgi:8-oxo-dGTP pyrophosphatase MutT (NUDIX family)
MSKEYTERSGLIPYYKDESGDIMVCLMIPSDPDFGGDRPQIAKGRIEENLDAERNAIKEAEEELGYIHKDHYEVKHLCYNAGILFYYVEVDDMELTDFGVETGEVLWLESKEALKDIRDWQKNILKKMLKII